MFNNMMLVRIREHGDFNKCKHCVWHLVRGCLAACRLRRKIAAGARRTVITRSDIRAGGGAGGNG
jgi:hypothetical protein